MGLALTLYGYARDPSAPDAGAGASVPQQRPAGEPAGDGAAGADLWGDETVDATAGSEPRGAGSWAADSGGSGSWGADSSGTGSWAADPGGSGSWGADPGGTGAQPADGSFTASGSWRVPAEDTGDQRSGGRAYDPGPSDGVGFDPLRSDFEAFRSDPAGFSHPGGSSGPGRFSEAGRLSDPSGFADPGRLSDPAGFADPAGLSDRAGFSDPGGFEAFRPDPGPSDGFHSGPGDSDPFRSEPRGFDPTREGPGESSGGWAATAGPGYPPDSESYQTPPSYPAAPPPNYPEPESYPGPGRYAGPESYPVPAEGFALPQRGASPTGYEGYAPGQPANSAASGGYSETGLYQPTDPDSYDTAQPSGYPPASSAGYPDADPRGSSRSEPDTGGQASWDSFRPDAVGYATGPSDPVGFQAFRPEGYPSSQSDPVGFQAFRPEGSPSDPGESAAGRPDATGHRDPEDFDPFAADPVSGYPGRAEATNDPRPYARHGGDAGAPDPRPREFDAGWPGPRAADAARWEPDQADPAPASGGRAYEPIGSGWDEAVPTAATGATVGGAAFIGFGPLGDAPRTGNIYGTGTVRSADGPSGTGAPAGSVDPAHEAAVAWASRAEVVGLEAPEIPPWDRRPLMVVLAAGAVLVLVAILAGAITSQLFRPEPAGWHPPGPRPSAGNPGPAPTAGSLAPPVGGDTVTLAGVGDVIMGTEPNKIPPANGNGFFDAVKGSLAADLVMGNLETALTVDTGRTKCPADSTGCFQFYLPPAYAGYLRAGGFSLMNLANNHTNDMGPQGLTNTRQALEAAGLQHTGAPNEITYVDVKGVKVAVLGFAVYSWGQNLNNIPAAVKLVAKAATNADLVVIQMQGGAEGADKDHVTPGHEMYLGEDRGDLIAFSHAVIDAGADVVFGHGPHVMRGMEFYKGRLIAYSLGNFCGYGVLNSAGYLGVGGVLKVSLHRDGSWAGGQLIATQMIKGGMVGLDPARRALAFVDGLSKEDFGQAGASVATADGSIAARS